MQPILFNNLGKDKFNFRNIFKNGSYSLPKTPFFKIRPSTIFGIELLRKIDRFFLAILILQYRNLQYKTENSSGEEYRFNQKKSVICKIPRILVSENVFLYF